MSHPEFAVFNHQIDVGDIDNDGDIDIVMAAPTRMVCLINKGDGTLKKRDYCARQVTAFGVELADMDGDGDLDIVAAAHEYEGHPTIHSPLVWIIYLPVVVIWIRQSFIIRVLATLIGNNDWSVWLNWALFPKLICRL